MEVLRTNPGRYPSPHADVTNSAALPAIFARNAALNGGQGTYLLNQAFPEGSPTHPSYGSGHATVAGACITVLKAFFDESAIIPNPVVPSADGTTLVPYTGADAGSLTVGGELNKVATNIAYGRDHAGVHWRGDQRESMLLGEQVGISILRDQYRTYNQVKGSGPGGGFKGYTFTKLDGTKITV
jgi:hypothetical protein